jgi:opacity protein-like surface antigen
MKFGRTGKRRALCLLAATSASLTLFNASAAMADGAASPVYDWSGLYAGVNVGAGTGAFKATTTTDAGAYFGNTGFPFDFDPSDVGTVNDLGKQKISPVGFTGGAEIGNNWQDGNFVGGIAADFDYLHMNGSSWRSAAYVNGVQFIESSYGNADWLVTLRPRVGYATDNKLFYVTGGLALANPREDTIFTDGNGAVESASRNALQAGYTIGAGLEWALSDRLSVKAEYLHLGFGGSGGHETSSNIVPPVIVPAQAFEHSFSFNADMVRLGLNYRFGDVDSIFDGSPMVSSGLPDFFSDWQADVGLRLWANSGRIGAPGPLFNYFNPPTQPRVLASRITFTQLSSIAAETYARFDHASGFFIKAYVGGGGINSGHQNDEDFPADNVYSNTLSTASGALGYATVDAGYSFLKSASANFGAFAGYNYYTEHVNTFGCVQIAQDYYCDVPSKSPGLIQKNAYHSLRLGVTSQFMPSDSLRFTTDIAYIPVSVFDGRDDHNFRQLLLPQSATSGDGVMLDASLDYLLTDAWSVGIGGRYWTHNMSNGATLFDFLGTPPPFFSEPSLYNSERYGFFLQSEYRFGAVEEPHAAAGTQAMDWSGVFAGATLSAGMSDEKWRDPYPSTTFFGYTNQAGFGDTDHATGPMVGGRVAANWQVDSFVFGPEVDVKFGDIHGEATCFSGLGGVGCSHDISAVYDIAARGGYAFDQSLAYLKVGVALVETKESIFGNTYGNLVGTSDVTGNGSTEKPLGGWLLGVGYEFAIGDNWTSSFEYNYIGGLDAKLSFPSVAVIGATTQHVSQSLNLIDVGLSYRLH